jgi:hypothetical protein
MADKTVKIEGPVVMSGAAGYTLNLQPNKAEAITIASEIIYPKGFLFIGVGGDIAVIPAENADAKNSDPTGYIVFKNIPSGSFFPIPIIRVGDAGSGTTATDIVICF